MRTWASSSGHVSPERMTVSATTAPTYPAAVSGTAAFKDGTPVAPGDAPAQTRHILDVITRALNEAGASIEDVIRYRVFLTDIADFPAVSAEMARVFGAVRPAGTAIGNSTLVDPALVVEIEVDAIVDSGA